MTGPPTSRARPEGRSLRRTTTTPAVAALARGWTTACEPPPPPASFTVNVAPGVTGGDANPGDGVCETAPGNGQCTLDAAVQEGNALGRADIHMTPTAEVSNPPVLSETTITGQLTVISAYEGVVREFEIRAPELHIAAGARLALQQAELLVTGTTTVEGALVLTRAMQVGWIDVRAGGLVSFDNSIGGVWASDLPPPATNAWITNRGTVILRFSEFQRFDHGAGTSMGAAFVHTLDGGSALIGATVFNRSGLASPDCLGTPPTSLGYNSTSGCNLSGPGDLEGAGSFPLRDIPLGTLGCGTEVTVTWDGHPRPAPDGAPRCSRGVWHG